MLTIVLTNKFVGRYVLTSTSFLPRKGKYESLLSYQKSVIVFDATRLFCERFFTVRDRTVDQMIQAARSGKQNIVEGSKAAVTSSETELKLTNVARASLEELLEDYRDFLRTQNFSLWDKDSRQARYIRNISSGKAACPRNCDAAHNSDDALRRAILHFIGTRSPEICANIMVCLVHQCNYLLDRQIRQLEAKFVTDGGLRERMFQARRRHRGGR